MAGVLTLKPNDGSPVLGLMAVVIRSRSKAVTQRWSGGESLRDSSDVAASSSVVAGARTGAS